MANQAPANPVAAWRCAACRHGRHLTAWATVLVHGPLDRDGTLASFDYDGESDVFADSIECSRHPGDPLERNVDGKWCRWWACPLCRGDGKSCPGEAPHQAWLTPREIARRPAVPGVGPGHVFQLGPGRNLDVQCRHCWVPLASIAGGRPCRGDRHTCPVAVPQGTPGAQQVYHVDGWRCYLDGAMSADFTSWTCRAGHLVRLGDHKPCNPHGCPCPQLGTPAAPSKPPVC